MEPEHFEFQDTWTHLVAALRDPWQTSDEARAELERASAASEETFREAAGDDARERAAASASRRLDVDEGIHRPLGTGLAACQGCGRVLLAEALAAHRRDACVVAREALGTSGVAAALGGVFAAVSGEGETASHTTPFAW